MPADPRHDGRLEEVGRSLSGLPLGIMPDYAYESPRPSLEPGETVILYTDGVTDAMDPPASVSATSSFARHS